MAAAAASQPQITLIVNNTPKTFTILKTLEGGTHPRLVQDEEGVKFVLKLSYESGGAQEANEYLAFQLYKAAGCKVPETYLVTDDEGRPGLLEEFIEGLTLRLLMNKRDSDVTSELHSKTFPAIQRDLVIHALLANWDINVTDNIMIPFTTSGTPDYANPYTLDCGGTLQFRAMGGIKPYTSNEMANIKSIVSYAQNYKPMGKLKSLDSSELKDKICERWRSVDKEAMLAAFDEITPQVEPIFEAARLKGLNLDEVRKVLVERMAYLDDYCKSAAAAAATAGAGAGAGAGAATTGGNSTPTLAVTYPPNLQVAGQQLTQQQTAAAPTFTVTNPTKRYALLLHDPDAVKPSYVHWLITDITAANPQGTTQIPYQGPTPPPGSAPVHRYIFTLFVQPANLQVPIQRAGFDVAAFLASVEQVASQHFTVKSPQSK